MTWLEHPPCHRPCLSQGSRDLWKEVGRGSDGYPLHLESAEIGKEAGHGSRRILWLHLLDQGRRGLLHRLLDQELPDGNLKQVDHGGFVALP
jgi:hypothetical protein